MSSNIKIQRICQHCQKEFTARTTVTKFCSDGCSKRAYKARIRNAKIENSNNETQKIITKQIDDLKAKEFLSIDEICQLTGISRRTLYRMITRGELHCAKFGSRTIIKRSEIDKLFSSPAPLKPQPEKLSPPVKLNENDCYNLTEIQTKYGISEKALHDLIKRRKIPKFKKGWFAYVPKREIDKLLS